MELAVLETYYDAAPRPVATTEEVGPFTLFVAEERLGHGYYGRPRLGFDGEVTPDDVRRLLDRQTELGLPHTIEWLHDVTPQLTAAVEALDLDALGLELERCPALVLEDRVASGDVPGLQVDVLDADSALLAETMAAVHASFSDSDLVDVGPVGRRPALIADGLMSVVAARLDGRVVAGGSHVPRGHVSELVGIGVLPSARKQGVGAAVTAALAADASSGGVSTVFLSAGDDGVARVYERVGFVRAGTACMVGPRS